MDSRKEKFWMRVRKAGHDECWVWLGSYRRSYGCFYHKGERFVAPRVSFELSKGPIMFGLKILHSCDTPACCNPNHLSQGTQKKNIVDAFKRGRLYANKISKLDGVQVQDIRFLCLELKFSHRKTGKIFEVNHRTIGRIISGQYWGHVKEGSHEGKM